LNLLTNEQMITMVCREKNKTQYSYW